MRHTIRYYVLARHVLTWSLIVCAGCTGRTATPKPVKPQTVTIEDAAELYFKNYAANAAIAAAKTADKCEAGEFRDITAADEFFNEATKAARLRANEQFAEKLTKALSDEKGKKAETVAPVYDDIANGFGRIGGVRFNRPPKSTPATKTKTKADTGRSKYPRM